MSELQAKLLVVVFFFSSFFAYAWPKLEEIKQFHDDTLQTFGTASVNPSSAVKQNKTVQPSPAQVKHVRSAPSKR